jgi:DNA-binding LytR/AlgR family response regulator
MTVAIIEDEALAADRLEGLLRQIDPSITVAAHLTSVESSRAWLRDHRPDLLFVDIHLSDGVSFEIFEDTGITVPVIFTTAYDQYALRAFKVNSIDYLLKPLRADDVRESLRKYRNVSTVARIDVEEVLRTLRGTEGGWKKRFLVQVGEKIRKVPVEEIAFFYALEKSVFLVTTQNTTLPADFTLDHLMDVLDPDRFFRINRKMIVCFDAIRTMTAYSRSRIKIELHPREPNDVEALVSVERAQAFRRWMDK